MTQAVVIRYGKNEETGDLDAREQTVYESAAEAVAAVEAAAAERGLDLAWAETQIGYQVSENDVDWDDLVEMWEIAGWEDGGISDLDENDDEE